MTKDNSYILSVGERAAQRLAIINSAYKPYSEQFLKQIGIKPGMSVLDVGCGSGNMSIWFAQQVGSKGKVVGVDNSGEQIAVAKNQAAQHHLNNTEFFTLGAYDVGTLNQKFDLAYCRFVLPFLKEPKKSLQAMYKILKPGGVLACEEIECSTWFGYPPSNAYDKHIELFIKLGALHGLDFNIGIKLYSYFRELDYPITHVSIAQPIFKTSEQKQHMELVTLECAQGFLDAKLITKPALDKLIKQLHELAQDDNFLMGGARIFQVAARKT